jgi:hypothetical protein
MKRICFIIITLLYFGQFSFAQPSSNYYENIDKAKNAFDKNEYNNSALFYSKAFEQNGGKAFLEDRYNSARSWTLAGNKDSAFAQLSKVVILYDYINFQQLSTDPAFNILWDDKRWEEINSKVEQNIGRSDSNLNKGLVLLLDSVYRKHHSYRLKEVSLKNEFGAESEKIVEIRKKIKQNDSINLSITTGIIDYYGWLGRNVIGFIGNYTLALIIQQADFQTQEKYLPKMREAFRNKNADAYDIALMEDKVALKKNKKQTFGSVIVNIENKNYVAPIEDIDGLEKRRADLGLKSMKTYLLNWGIKWDIESYKKNLSFVETENPKH